MIPLSIDAINNCFQGKAHQADAWIALYRIAFPDWDEIKSIDSYPSVSAETDKYIFAAFIQFDQFHHPGVQVGGMWLNSGFRSQDGMPNWCIDTDGCTIYYNDGLVKEGIDMEVKWGSS